VNIELDPDDFEQWRDHPITQLVINLHKDRKQDLYSFVKDAMETGTVLSEIEQVRFHAALGMYEDFIELGYHDLLDFYQEREDD